MHCLGVPRKKKGFNVTAGIWFQAQIVLENLETKKIVLVHGEGFGAWCWYKTISHLEEAGLEPVALDLTGSGIDHTDTNSIATLGDYSKPLIDYLDKLPEDEKVTITFTALCKFMLGEDKFSFMSTLLVTVIIQVILVGHSCGGASVSYALEHCPKKISKAVFLTATMVKDGQRPFDVFSEEVRDLSLYVYTSMCTFNELTLICILQLRSADVFLQESQFLVYGNGKDKPPTGLMFDKQQIKGLYFNQTPSKVHSGFSWNVYCIHPSCYYSTYFQWTC